MNLNSIYGQIPKLIICIYISIKFEFLFITHYINSIYRILIRDNLIRNSFLISTSVSSNGHLLIEQFSFAQNNFLSLTDNQLMQSSSSYSFKTLEGSDSCNSSSDKSIYHTARSSLANSNQMGKNHLVLELKSKDAYLMLLIDGYDKVQREYLEQVSISSNSASKHQKQNLIKSLELERSHILKCIYKLTDELLEIIIILESLNKNKFEKVSKELLKKNSHISAELYRTLFFAEESMSRISSIYVRFNCNHNIMSKTRLCEYLLLTHLELKTMYDDSLQTLISIDNFEQANQKKSNKGSKKIHGKLSKFFRRKK